MSALYKMQKFPLRFSSWTDSLKFMDSLESLKEGRNCSSGVSHCGFTEGFDEERNLMWQASAVQEHGSYSYSEQAAQGPAVGGTDVALPENFTSLLADSCTETDQGIPQASPGVNGKHLLRAKKEADHFVGHIGHLVFIMQPEEC